jgi:hypothetical protein
MTTTTTTSGGGGCQQPGASCTPDAGWEEQIYGRGDCCAPSATTTMCMPLGGEPGCCVTQGSPCDEVTPCCDGTSCQYVAGEFASCQP